MVLKSAQERNAALEKRVQSIIVEANGEISLLQQKTISLEKGRRRASEMAAIDPMRITVLKSAALPS